MSAEGEQLRNEMQAIRFGLGDEVEHTVENLRTMTDWRLQVRNHPWLCLGAVGLAGFLVVPSKSNIVLKADADSFAEFVRGGGLRLARSNPSVKSKGTLTQMAVGMIARAAMAYATKRLSETVARIAASRAEHNESANR